jgi:hypothetical protein
VGEPRDDVQLAQAGEGNSGLGLGLEIRSAHEGSLSLGDMHC